DGAYYLAAAIDTAHEDLELREDNNVCVGGLVGVGYRSDLVVTELRGPASLSHGQDFLASVKVCNQGTTSTNGYASGMRLELFLSMDSELTLPGPSMPSSGMPEDQSSLGYVELDSLYEGQCVTKSVPAHATLPPAAQGDGAYYLAAAIDTEHAEQELREDNNVLVSGRVGVGHRSDLVVTELSVPASLGYHQDFTASVKVCNQGTATTGGGASPSYGTPGVELFLSMDTELTLPEPSSPYPNGPGVDQRSIGQVDLDQPLYPGRCVTKSIQASAWLPPAAQGEGTYYLAAAVDTGHAAQELREDNNVRVSGPVGVGHKPDLVVTGLSAPASLGHGQDFMASVKVCNQGTRATSSTSRLDLFLSMDTELTLPDPYMPSPGTPMDQAPVGFVDLMQILAPGQCVTTSVEATATLPPAAQGDGAFHLIAAIDTTRNEQELREDNNAFVGGLVGVGYRADLVVTELRGPANVWPGQDFTASVKVCNQGTAPIDSGAYHGPRLELFLSMDTELTLPAPSMPTPGTPADQHSIGYVELSQPLGPGQCVTASVPASATPPPQAPGNRTYYLVAAIDTTQAEEELREDNNVLVSGLMGVGYRSDLVVTAVNAPGNIEPWQPFTAAVTVCNQGTTPSAGDASSGPWVDLFLSMDAELTPPDPSHPSPELEREQRRVGTVALSQPLAPGQCVTESVPASAWLPHDAPPDSPLYLAAIADSGHQEEEFREDNNVHVGGLIHLGSPPAP
ncbi:MAG TPA: CARDB domain-containing protein, partial [Archangium sp.]|nr:CARDB domain-containing protein [Archangium sp.]